MNASPSRSRKATLAIRHVARKSTRNSNLPLLLSPPFTLSLLSPFDGLIHSSDFFEQQLFLVEQDHHFCRSCKEREREDPPEEGRVAAYHIRRPSRLALLLLAGRLPPPSHFVTRPKQKRRCNRGRATERDCPRLRGHSRRTEVLVASSFLYHFIAENWLAEIHLPSETGIQGWDSMARK